MESWQPPAILAALILPATAGFLIAGPGLGITIAGLSLVALVVIVLRMVPRDPIGRGGHPELDRKLLVVTTFPIEDAGTIQRVADEVELGFADESGEVRLLTPARNTFLRRWATDLEAARARAQRDLVVSLASLTLAGVEADAKVGDEDLVQAIEDQLADYDATQVFLLTEGDEHADAVETLRARLRPAFRHTTLSAES